jgi:hypothetical protein
MFTSSIDATQADGNGVIQRRQAARFRFYTSSDLRAARVMAAFLAAERRRLVFAALIPAARLLRVVAALRPAALRLRVVGACLPAARRFLVAAAFLLDLRRHLAWRSPWLMHSRGSALGAHRAASATKPRIASAHSR